MTSETPSHCSYLSLHLRRITDLYRLPTGSRRGNSVGYRPLPIRNRYIFLRKAADLVPTHSYRVARNRCRVYCLRSLCQWEYSTYTCHMYRVNFSRTCDVVSRQAVRSGYITTLVKTCSICWDCCFTRFARCVAAFTLLHIMEQI